MYADSCADYANSIFNNAGSHNGAEHVLGAVFFAIQIYCDFSGYSDIALGTARLFGVELLRNFAFPYFSRDIAEFWRRWHISLSSWFRDYLYIPLGGSKGNHWVRLRNTFIIFLVSGFWHGANWTFIVWGVLNALYFFPLLLLKRNRNNLEIAAKGKVFPTLKEVFGIISTFILTTFAWIFFRAQSIGEALSYISVIFSKSLFKRAHVPGFLVGTIVFFFIIEWLGREQEFGLQKTLSKSPRLMRWVFYLALVIVILFQHDDQQQFIYFHF